MNHIDWWRNATPEQKAQRSAEMAAEREAQTARREAEAAEYRAKRTRGLSDEGLAESIAAGDLGTSGSVHPRQARVLLTLPTVAHRERALAEAGTRQNLMGGRFSDVLHYVALDLNRMIAAGTEDDEMYGAGVARKAREADRAARDARMDAAIKAMAR